MPPEHVTVTNELSGRAHSVVQAGQIGQVHFHMTGSAVDLGGLSRPISGWNPFDLAIHPSLTTRSDLPALPTYFHRRHDDALDDALSNPQRSVMVVLIGSSSTGKTRALYEAIRRHAVLSQWPLTYPQDARDLDRALDARQVVPHTVLWLNETQEYMSGEHGESVAARLRTLINGTIAGPWSWSAHSGRNTGAS